VIDPQTRNEGEEMAKVFSELKAGEMFTVCDASNWRGLKDGDILLKMKVDPSGSVRRIVQDHKQEFLCVRVDDGLMFVVNRPDIAVQPIPASC
jgi:hypothetical protein